MMCYPPAVARTPLQTSVASQPPVRLQEKAAPQVIQNPINLVTLLLSRASKPVTQQQVVPPLAWHVSKQQLAVADDSGAVQIFAPESVPSSKLSQQAPDIPSPRPTAVLQHEEQQTVFAIEYRPYGGGMLAVATQSCAVLWNPSQPAPTTSDKAAAQFRILRPQRPTRIASLAWSPTGSHLAGAHADSPGFTVWNAALGSPTTVSSGWVAMSLLRWSPDGSFLLSAGEGGFQLWETERWSNATWKSASAGRLLEARWAPGSKTVLLAFSNSSQLMVLYLVGRAPELKAQLLPLELPAFAEGAREGNWISGFDWDGLGQRLAVVCGPRHSAAGRVALFATLTSPVVSAQFLGMIQRGGGEGDEQPAVRFACKYERGALLAIRNSQEQLAFVPLLFAAERTQNGF